MRKIFLFFILIFLFIIAGCVKPLSITPSYISKEGIDIKVSILDSYDWRLLAKDILVLNLEIFNGRNEPIWVFPLSKSVIIDSKNRQYFPVREFQYVKTDTKPKVSFEITFSTQEPPQGKLSISLGDEKKDEEILKLINKYEVLKFKDGKILEGASVSGIIIFYMPNYISSAKYIIPEVYLEKSNRYVDFEFIFER
ncbi:MAG: hypothetical protein CBR30_00175 [Dictyoglomus sp. NZ13-RE01]|nr:MAG: hypothetical protein CBR30_00175 [Dictyoglomus sp. NZ13-RE01]